MIIPVILAGGSGTRLWPLSREFHPKQLLHLAGEQTMLQNTVLRLAGLDQVAAPIIIGSEAHRFMVDQQLAAAGIQPSAIFLEPVGRNTAPAVTVAALKALSLDRKSLILVLPADHLISDVPAFHSALQTGQGFAEQGFLVTFGIVPDRPETGYGYIRQGAPASILKDDDSNDAVSAYAIDEFVEKPDLDTAKQYLAEGNYCWNSGMFMFLADRVLEELRRFAPDIVRACERSFENGQAEQRFFHLDHDAFSGCRSDSIDYAIMEKTDRGVMVPLAAGWDDLGSWEALWNVGKKDDSGNVITGDVVCVDVENTLVSAQSRLVTVLGVRNLAVVETPDALLVAALSDTQGVKKIVDALKSGHRKETRVHAQVIQPWGVLESMAAGENFQVRKVTVSPGARVNLAGHEFSAVDWSIIEGAARLQIDEKSIELTKNQYFCPEARKAFVLENSGQAPLIFIEVCSGHPAGCDHFGSIG